MVGCVTQTPKTSRALGGEKKMMFENVEMELNKLIDQWVRGPLDDGSSTSDYQPKYDLVEPFMDPPVVPLCQV